VTPTNQLTCAITNLQANVISSVARYHGTTVAPRYHFSMVPVPSPLRYFLVPQYHKYRGYSAWYLSAVDWIGLDWIEQGLTSPPTQYGLSGRQFYRSKDPTNSPLLTHSNEHFVRLHCILTEIATCDLSSVIHR